MEVTKSAKTPRMKGQRFSPDTQKLLLDIINDKRICGEIELRCMITEDIPEWRPSAEIRAEIVRVRDAVKNLLKAIDSTHYESGIFIRMCAETSEDQEIRKLGIQTRPQSSEEDALEQFLEQAALMEKLLSETISNYRVQRGRKRKSSPMFMALAVMEIFDANGLRATTYQDGQFFRSLEAIFSDLLPELGEDAYRRYGEIAIKEKTRYYAVCDRIT